VNFFYGCVVIGMAGSCGTVKQQVFHALLLRDHRSVCIMVVSNE
jgi:hypothetical protein